MRMERKSTVDRARGGASESCRTTRLHLQLSRVGDFIQWKVSSTWYMCPWEHFHAYGGEFVGQSCPSESCRTIASTCNLAEWRIRTDEGVEHKVHESVGTFPCV